MGKKSKYKSLAEWKKAQPKNYQRAYNKDWIDQICDEIGWEKPKRTTKKRIPSSYWTKENVLAEAKKYKTKTEWSNGSSGSYKVSKENDWHEEATAHMVSIKMPFNYWTKENVLAEAKKYKTKTEWSNGSSGSYKVSKNNDWHEEATAHMKDFFIPSSYWTKENVLAEAKKYKTKTEWGRGSNGSYKVSKKNGWDEEATAHMTKYFTPKEWTKERCIAEAKKYDMKEAWKKGHNKSYSASRRHGWHEECVGHMVEGCKPPNYWTKEKCINEAKKYTVKEHWKKGHYKSYNAAQRNGWYYEITTHMVSPTKPNGYWNEERCIENAKKFKTVTEWTKANSTPVINARKHGWYDECTKHMTQVAKPVGYWDNKENVLAEARRHKSKSEWSKANSTSYKVSKEKGWFEEAIAHMANLYGGKKKKNKK